MPSAVDRIRSARRKIRIGISSCLLGFEVRYDGGHKRDAFLTDVLGRYVEWVNVCPEFELGLGVPREPIELVETEGEVRLLGVRHGTDHTDAMREYAGRRVAALGAEKLSGFVLKEGSPSCGLFGVRVRRGRDFTSNARGVFAQVLLEHFPDLPVEEERRLADPRLRDEWIDRVLALK